MITIMIILAIISLLVACGYHFFGNDETEIINNAIWFLILGATFLFLAKLQEIKILIEQLGK